MRPFFWLALLAFSVSGCELAIPYAAWDAPADRTSASSGASAPVVARLDPVSLRMGEAMEYKVHPPNGARVAAVYPDCDSPVRSRTEGFQGIVLNRGFETVSCEIAIELPPGEQFGEAWNTQRLIEGQTFEYFVPPDASADWLVRAVNRRLALEDIRHTWTLTDDGWWNINHGGRKHRAPVWATALRLAEDGLTFFCTDGSDCIETEGERAWDDIWLPAPNEVLQQLTRIRLMEVRRQVLNVIVAQSESTNPSDYLAILADTFHLYHPTGALGVNADDNGWLFALDGTRYAARFGTLNGGDVDGQPALVCRDESDCIVTSDDEPIGAVVLGLDPITPPGAYQSIIAAFERVESLAEQRRGADLAQRDSVMNAVLEAAQAQAARADSLARALAADTREAKEPVNDAPAPEPVQWRSVEGALDGTQGEFQLSPDHSGPAVPYELELTEGDTLYVEMISSDFDAFLTLADTGGYVLHNDDLGFSLNAGFRYVVPATGAYGILAGSASSDARGSFTLRLRTE